MLDIHPPHEAAHTWKDLFIHIATIVIGLLIAIGLEQTVELFHYHHQRQLSEERIRNQAERNRDFVDGVERWDFYVAQNSSRLLDPLHQAP